MIRRFNWQVAVLVVATVLSFLWLVSAFAHGPAEWIQRGQYKNGAGELCCGPTDCRRLDDGDVVPVPGGYFIKSMNHVVPTHEAMPISPDGYFVCVWGGVRKCFF